MQFITLLDYALLPFTLAFVYGLAYRTRNRKYPPKHPWHTYYIPGLTVKVVGAIFIGVIYQYYYGNGDTFNFFRHSLIINSAAEDSLGKWINLLLHIPSATDIDYYSYTSRMFWYHAGSSYTVAAIAAFFSFFTFNTYLPAAVLFAYFSFSGVWALFRTFAPLYPKLTRPIAIAILFIPSVFVWGSGIFKDTVCLFGLGWMTYGSFRLLVHRDFSVKNIALTLLSFFIIYKVKLYILLGFLPALVMWILFNYTQRIANPAAKNFVKFGAIGAILLGSVFFMNRFSDELGRYSLENIVATSSSTRNWILRSTDDEGSAYDLGTFDPSPEGMLLKFPLAVNVTLFRPYLWEAKKVIVLLSAVEAVLFLWITLKTLFVVGLRRVWKTISGDPTIQFCLIFSVIFAFAVGISTYNFGSLSRYKIPCLPFYALVLVLIYYKNVPPSKRLLGKLL